MTDKIPSKADALRALREANYAAKSSEVGKPAPRMSTPSAVRGKSIGANDMPSPETSGASESNSAVKRPKSPAPDLAASHNSGERVPSSDAAGSVAEAKPERKRAPNGTFDRKAYQREYMRSRRQKAQEN